MKRRSVAELADAIWGWAEFPDFAPGNVTRRPLRWPATMALALAYGGFGLILAEPQLFYFGWSVQMFGFSAGILLVHFGPVKPYGAIEAVDEREQVVRSRSYLAGYSIMAVTAIVGLTLMLVLSFQEEWNINQLRFGMIGLMFLLMTVCFSMPTAYASWTMPPPVGDD